MVTETINQRLAVRSERSVLFEQRRVGYDTRCNSAVTLLGPNTAALTAAVQATNPQTHKNTYRCYCCTAAAGAAVWEHHEQTGK